MDAPVDFHNLIKNSKVDYLLDFVYYNANNSLITLLPTMKNTFYQFLANSSRGKAKFSQDYQEHYYLIPLTVPPGSILTIDSYSYKLCEQHITVFNNTEMGVFHLTLSLISKETRLQYKTHLFYEYGPQHSSQKFAPKKNSIVLLPQQGNHHAINIASTGDLYEHGEYYVSEYAVTILKEQELLVASLEAQLHQKISAYSQEQISHHDQTRCAQDILRNLEQILQYTSSSRNFYKRLQSFYTGVIRIMSTPLAEKALPIPTATAESCSKIGSIETLKRAPTPKKKKKSGLSAIGIARKAEPLLDLVSWATDMHNLLLTCENLLSQSLSHDILWVAENREPFDNIIPQFNMLELHDMTIDGLDHNSLAHKSIHIVQQWESIKTAALIQAFHDRNFALLSRFTQELTPVIKYCINVAIEQDYPEWLEFLVQNSIIDLNTPFVFEDSQVSTLVERAYRNYSLSKSVRCLYYLVGVSHYALFSILDSGLPLFHELDSTAGKDLDLYEAMIPVAAQRALWKDIQHAYQVSLKSPKLSHEIKSSFAAKIQAYSVLSLSSITGKHQEELMRNNLADKRALQSAPADLAAEPDRPQDNRDEWASELFFSHVAKDREKCYDPRANRRKMDQCGFNIELQPEELANIHRLFAIKPYGTRLRDLAQPEDLTDGPLSEIGTFAQTVSSPFSSKAFIDRKRDIQALKLFSVLFQLSEAFLNDRSLRDFLSEEHQGAYDLEIKNFVDETFKLIEYVITNKEGQRACESKGPLNDYCQLKECSQRLIEKYSSITPEITQRFFKECFKKISKFMSKKFFLQSAVAHSLDREEALQYIVDIKERCLACSSVAQFDLPLRAGNLKI